MTEWLRQIALAAGDLILGWLLYLPSDAVVILLALGSAVLLVLVRKAKTDQDLLRRCAADKKRVRVLLREARAKRDREAVARLRETRSRISLKQLRAELVPLAYLFLPVAFLANWAWHRLEFHSPRAGEVIQVRATFPVAAAGDVAHLVPQDGMSAAQGWIQPVATVTTGRISSRGAALWRISVGTNAGTLPLVMRHRQRVFDWNWRFGRTRIDPLSKQFSDGAVGMEIVLRPVKLFGVVPGLRWLGLPPWLVGYLVLTGLFVALLKRWWKVS